LSHPYVQAELKRSTFPEDVSSLFLVKLRETTRRLADGFAVEASAASRAAEAGASEEGRQVQM